MGVWGLVRNYWLRKAVHEISGQISTIHRRGRVPIVPTARTARLRSRSSPHQWLRHDRLRCVRSIRIGIALTSSPSLVAIVMAASTELSAGLAGAAEAAEARAFSGTGQRRTNVAFKAYHNSRLDRGWAWSLCGLILLQLLSCLFLFRLVDVGQLRTVDLGVTSKCVGYA